MTKHIMVVTHVRWVVIMRRLGLTRWIPFVAEGPSVAIRLKHILIDNVGPLHFFICNFVTSLSAIVTTCSYACRLANFSKTLSWEIFHKEANRRFSPNNFVCFFVFVIFKLHFYRSYFASRDQYFDSNVFMVIALCCSLLCGKHHNLACR